MVEIEAEGIGVLQNSNRRGLRTIMTPSASASASSAAASSRSTTSTRGATSLAFGAALTAVCDVDPAKAKAAGETFGVPLYADVKTLLVGREARRGRHRDPAGHASRARRGDHCARCLATIVQKPFAPTWEDATAIVEAARRAGVWLAVHENFRFQAPLRAVRKVIDSGAIGEPSLARIPFRTGFDVYKARPYFLDEERLVIADVGVHLLDLSRFLLGDVSRISCEIQRRNPKVKAEDDTATMLLRRASGAVSVVEVTYEARRGRRLVPETLVEIEGAWLDHRAPPAAR